MNDARKRLEALLADEHTIYHWIAPPEAPKSPRPYFLRATMAILDHPALIAAILLAVIAWMLSDCAHAGEYWYKTAEPAAVVTETYVDKVACDDDADALGCFLMVGNVGIILIRKGMPEYLRRCTLAHERKHARGWRHPKGWFGFVDCGNGEWISGAALRNMGE